MMSVDSAQFNKVRNPKLVTMFPETMFPSLPTCF